MAIKESSGSKNDPCMHAVLSEALSSILSCPYFSLEQVVLCPKKKKKKKKSFVRKEWTVWVWMHSNSKFRNQWFRKVKFFFLAVSVRYFCVMFEYSFVYLKWLNITGYVEKCWRGVCWWVYWLPHFISGYIMHKVPLENSTTPSQGMRIKM